MEPISSSLLQKGVRQAKSIPMKEDIDHQALAQCLVEVATERSKKAFTHLFTFFAPKIQRIAASKYGNESLAAEVVQETMTNVWRKAHLFDASKGSPTTWVYTVMRNVSFDLLRKIKAKKEDNLSDDFWPLVDAVEEDIAPFEDHLASKEVQACIDQLPDNHISWGEITKNIDIIFFSAKFV